MDYKTSSTALPVTNLKTGEGKKRYIIMTQKICFTGGGTGGHVIPGLAVASCIAAKKPYEVFWIGSGKSIERTLVQKAGIRFRKIPAGKLRRYFSLQNIIDMFRVIAGILSSFFILAGEKPAVLFSKGGYVSVPPVIAARLLKIPVVTHESDFDPGLATRLSARQASRICVSYSETSVYFPEVLQKRISVTGNPVREAILTGVPEKGRILAGCPKNLPLVLVLGGSLGARAVNSLIDGIKDSLAGKAFLVHQRGAGNMAQVPADPPHVLTRAYFDEELPHILAAADLVVSRAGANTLWELAAARKASVLIPLSTSGSRGDQLRNAALFEKTGASRVLQEDSATSQQLLEIILDLVDNGTVRNAMGVAAGKLFRPDAAERIADIIIETALERKPASHGD